MAARDPSKPVQVSGSEEDRLSGNSQTFMRKISVENADKYIMGMCRAVFNMLRLAISAEMILQRMGMTIQSFYCHIMKKKDLDLNIDERLSIELISHLRELFPSITGQVCERDSEEEKEEVRKKLQAIILAIKTDFKSDEISLLYNKRIEEFRTQSFNLTHQTSQQLSHALMDQLLMKKDISKLCDIATSLNLFGDDYGKENSEEKTILAHLCEMSKRKERYGTHEQRVADDVKVYNSFKKLMTERLTPILDQEMMEFPDYDKEIIKDQMIQELIEELHIAFEQREGGNILQKINSNLARGSKIAPQILVEMYLGLFICKKLDEDGSLERSFLKIKAVQCRDPQCPDAQYPPYPHTYLVYENLTQYQRRAFDLYYRLKKKPKFGTLTKQEKTDFIELRRKNDRWQKKKSEFFTQTAERLKTGGPIPVRQLRIAVLHEVLAEMSDGLGYLLRNTPLIDSTFYKNMWELLNIVNEGKHQLGIDAASDIKRYLRIFEKLVNGFFCPKLSEIYPEENMKKQTEECKQIYYRGYRLLFALELLCRETKTFDQQLIWRGSTEEVDSSE